MTDARIVVTRRPPAPDALDTLAAAGDVWCWDEGRPIDRDVLLRQVGDCDGLYCMLTDAVDQELLDAAPRLQVVSSMAVGVDNVDLAACTARGIPVGHTPDVLTETTADLVFALLLAAARRLGEGRDFVRAGGWGPWDPELLLGEDVHGSTLGIVGMGRIGEAVARRAAGFGMRVLYHNRRPRPGAGAEYRSFAGLLAEADHVVVLVPLTEATDHLFDASAFAQMRPTATFVNASRGPVVDQDALGDALAGGRIAAAALDVTDPEPLPADHPLLALPNCFVVPHVGSATRRARAAMADLAAANLLAGLRGERLPSCANPEAYENPGFPQKSS